MPFHLPRCAGELGSPCSIPKLNSARFANRSERFMDAYNIGLNGSQAAWAARKYRGHRTLQEWIWDELEAAGLM
ncbi:hypothetical protein B0H11DRAFT_1746798 [Mycena galericulata]|nr:hypothetical protein B0H11DRAFT_1746798 [Mycena galericulata]